MAETPTSVECAVKEMLEDAAPKETASTETPASDTSEKERQSAADSQESSEELTAFEQELIGELDEEDKAVFEQGSPEARKQALAFMKKQYRRNAKSMTELGTLRKAVGALRDAGITNEDLVKLVQDKRGGTKAEAQTVVDAATNGGGKRGYTRWMEQAKTSEEREALRDAEQVVREVVEDVVASIVQREVKPLRDRLDYTDRESVNQRAQGLEAEINALEDTLGYPGSLVETYRQQMLNLGLREPKLSAEDLLVRAAGFSTVKAAMLKMQAGEGEGKDKTSPNPLRPHAPVFKRPGTATEELPRRKGGGISISRALDI